MTNIHLADTFNNCRQEFKADKRLTLAKKDETASQTIKTILQYIIAILLES